MSDIMLSFKEGEDTYMSKDQGMFRKTMGEQHAGLGIVNWPVSILNTAGETLHTR